MSSPATDEAGTLSLSDARAQLGERVTHLKPGERLDLTRHGKTVATVISPEELQLLNLAKDAAMKSTKVLMCFNHAGGASKSSTTRDLGYELTQLGQKVLLIDLDPQANLTSWLGLQNVQLSQTVNDALLNLTPLPEPLEAHGMSIIPSHIDLSETGELLGVKGNGDGRLEIALQKVRSAGIYDYILIDPPPALGKLTTSGARAADYLIVPLPAKYKGVEALGGVQRMVSEYSVLNPKLRVAFYVVTQMEKTRHASDVLSLYRQTLGDKVIGPISWRPKVYNECQPMGLPIGVMFPDDSARAEIQEIAHKLMEVVAAGVYA
ncbi:chromosome partitioning protein ParA [Deinococcus ruber]|uniref:Chromosome partitioning protein ParA n=1 Tax=Deinococcus ruber TaxID=1848197 RepID=A0A918F6H9_9DEIO|nr:chromosome partitioning protein ParA [Deinococcus ruber]